MLVLSKSVVSFVFGGADLEERVGRALGGVKLILLVRDAREPEAGDLGVVINGEVLDVLTLLVEDGD